MIGKIIKYIAIVGATAAVTASAPDCFRGMAYSDLKAAEGSPEWERAKNLNIEYVENKGNLETFVKDGSNMIPVYEREGSIMIGAPSDECSLFTPQEKLDCISSYNQKMKETGQVSDAGKGIGQWLGDKLRKGGDVLDDVLDGVKEGYNSSPEYDNSR